MEFSSDSDFEDEPTSPKKPPEPVIDLSKDESDDTNLEVKCQRLKFSFISARSLLGACLLITGLLYKRVYMYL